MPEKIKDSYFLQVTNQSPYADVHGQIDVYNENEIKMYLK